MRRVLLIAFLAGCPGSVSFDGSDEDLDPVQWATWFDITHDGDTVEGAASGGLVDEDGDPDGEFEISPTAGRCEIDCGDVGLLVGP